MFAAVTHGEDLCKLAGPDVNGPLVTGIAVSTDKGNDRHLVGGWLLVISCFLGSLANQVTI